MKLAFHTVVIAAAVLGATDALEDYLRRPPRALLNGSEETGEEVVPDQHGKDEVKPLGPPLGPCCSW